MIGPISAAIEADLSARLREHRLVLWLDPARAYSALAADLAARHAAGQGPAPVLIHDGSALAMLFALEAYIDGLELKPALLYLPGFTAEHLPETPLLEAAELGHVLVAKPLRFWLEAAAAGRVAPDRLAAFLQGPAPTLQAAEAWMTAVLDEARGGLAALLADLSLPTLMDALLEPEGGLRARVSADPGGALAALKQRCGLDGQRWQPDLRPTRAEEVAFLLASYAMAAEYVHDLRRAPREERLRPLQDLPEAVVEALRGLCAHLRERHPELYARTADESEGLLTKEVLDAKPEDLGQIDTFRFEEQALLKGALAALEQERWGEAAAWAGPRAAGSSFWTQRSAERQGAWALVADAAALGAAVAQASAQPGLWQSADEALDDYVARGAAVDRAHRRLEQRWTTVWPLALPMREALRAPVEALRQVTATWAEDSAQRFNALCQRVGPLPDPSRQQRHLFDQVVRPLLGDGGPVALFLLDALRYELAIELAEALREERGGATVTLDARLAELPSNTAVGMNALAVTPLDGRLSPVIRQSKIMGFQASELQVISREHRKAALSARAGGGTRVALDLDAVTQQSASSLRAKVRGARLVVVIGDDVDSAGEAGHGLEVFEAALMRTRAAWRALREAGVRHFVFTADHGFLLVDPRTAPRQWAGRPDGLERRAVLTDRAEQRADTLSVPLSALGYEGPPLHYVTPMGLAIFDTRRPTPSFAHGGNSLPERVIPVLSVVHRGAPGGDGARYALALEPAEAGRPDEGAHALRLRLSAQDQTGLRFGSGQRLLIALRAVDAPEVSVELVGVGAGGALQAGGVTIELDAWVEVYFRLVGPEDRRARVEASHPTGEAEVASARSSVYFEVRGRRPAEPPPDPSSAAAPTPDAWLDALPAEVRPVFRHLAQHGVLTEAELIATLGSARAARRFTLHLEAWLPSLPFGVKVETAGGQRSWTREGGRR